MQRKTQYQWRGILFAVSLAALGVLGWLGTAGAATPPRTQGPVIADPFHHLSGVLLYPPDRMRAARGGPGVIGAPALPVFGANVSASLGNGSAQNETTIAINPEDDQRMIGSANDYRCNLCPY